MHSHCPAANIMLLSVGRPFMNRVLIGARNYHRSKMQSKIDAFCVPVRDGPWGQSGKRRFRIFIHDSDLVHTSNDCDLAASDPCPVIVDSPGPDSVDVELITDLPVPCPDSVDVVLITDSPVPCPDSVDVVLIVDSPGPCPDSVDVDNIYDSMPALISGSEDSDGPISRGAQREAMLAFHKFHKHATVMAAPSLDSDAVVPAPAIGIGPIDIMNLWKAVPKNVAQFLDTEAKHHSDTDRDNTSDDSDDVLSPGFISDGDDAWCGVPEEHRDFVSSMLPITARALLREKRRKVSTAKALTHTPSSPPPTL